MQEEINSKLDEIRNEFNVSIINDINDPDILLGHASISLFLFNYYKINKDKKDLFLALDFLDKSISLISENCSHFSLSGLSGISWLIVYAKRNDYVDTDMNEMLEEVDHIIYKYIEMEYEKANFDFLHGICGSILYLLQRDSNSNCIKHISNFVDKLELAAEFDQKNSICKWSSEIFRDGKNISVFNLSLSHGIAAIISILTKIHKQNINRTKVNKLLTGAINFVLSCEIKTKDSKSKFPNYITPNYITPNYRSKSSDLRWCYGDVGIAFSLYNASVALKDNSLKNKSIEILLHSSYRRDLNKNGIADASFCHGSSGLAYMYNKIYFETGINQFHETANYWHKKTLEFSKYENGLAGYKAKYKSRYEPKYGLLLGISGIGLSFFSYNNSNYSDWDELLLLS